MRTYTISMRVEKGTGDYGSDFRTIFDGKSSKDNVVSAARALREAGNEVLVFCGKDTGKLTDI